MESLLWLNRVKLLAQIHMSGTRSLTPRRAELQGFLVLLLSCDLLQTGGRAVFCLVLGRQFSNISQPPRESDAGGPPGTDWTPSESGGCRL